MLAKPDSDHCHDDRLALDVVDEAVTLVLDPDTTEASQLSEERLTLLFWCLGELVSSIQQYALDTLVGDRD